jgi:hypothetical protein
MGKNQISTLKTAPAIYQLFHENHIGSFRFLFKEPEPVVLWTPTYLKNRWFK